MRREIDGRVLPSFKVLVKQLKITLLLMDRPVLLNGKNKDIK